MADAKAKARRKPVVNVPRPAKGFTTARAQKWVLTVAIVDGLIYLVRHLIEGETSPAPASNAARQFLGQGSPPSFGQWIVAYGASFLGLALLAAAAPELAGSLAIFVLAATFIESGGQFATDLGQLGAGGPKLAGVQAPTANVGQLTTPLTNLATDPFGTAPSPQSVGAAAAAALAKSQKTAGASVKSPFGFGVTDYHSPGTPSLSQVAASQHVHYDPATGEFEPN